MTHLSTNKSSYSLYRAPNMLRYRLYFRMIKMKKLLISIFLIISLMLPLASCGNRINSTWVPNNLGVNLSSDSLYVRKVDNITDEFIMGRDASCVPALEASGVKYYDLTERKRMFI